MAADNKSKASSVSNNSTTSKKRKQRYRPHNKPVKKKGQYPLHPGVQGFFITCDGGREHQASREAINVIDSFYEELVSGNDSGIKLAELPRKPLNTKIKFSYSDSSSSDEDEDDDDSEEEDKEDNKSASHKLGDASNGEARTETLDSHKNNDDVCPENYTAVEPNDNKEVSESLENQANEAEDPPAKKQCIETNVSKPVIPNKVEEKSVDKLIDAEIKELGDTNKRRFGKLDSGCNGVVFVQMRKEDGDPGPKDIVQHIMTSAAATRKHMSRFILRVLPVEVACYASEEEITKAIAPLVAQYFPVETENPIKFAVLYEARANTGIDRMKIINAVAKSVPGPHKVDLNNPDKTIVVEIVRTVCLIGVVEKYKELAKYNLRQLTSAKP
nr:LOW QUALITY PROTEIN: THUMP domain-containing protein 1 homolog [Ziziphus jujuba var. spinosa]